MSRILQQLDDTYRSLVRIATIATAAFSIIAIGAVIYSFRKTGKAQDKIYVLANGRAIEALCTDTRTNMPVEARDHIRCFHQYFFTIDPDERAIRNNISRALYLADLSAKQQYDVFREKHYYTDLITANISQRITVDSIQLDMDHFPYAFRCYSTEEITRATSVTTRILITTGSLRTIGRSDNNPHGFLIENFVIAENTDLHTETRK